MSYSLDNGGYVTPEREAEYQSSPYNYRLKAGLHNVGTYQVSAVPWVTSSVAPASGSTPLQIAFPSVTKFVIVKNIDSSSSAVLNVGFSANGVVGTNYLSLAKNESFTADIKVTDLFLISNDSSPVSASIFAGLTGISRAEISNNWSGSSGIG